jgi:hypothetical protein
VVSGNRGCGAGREWAGVGGGLGLPPRGWRWGTGSGLPPGVSGSRGEAITGVAVFIRGRGVEANREIGNPRGGSCQEGEEGVVWEAAIGRLCVMGLVSEDAAAQ